jgi:glycosyltransferase involved in cell wall biosynthesis
LFRILRKEKIDSVFAHMNILFAAMAGPILKVMRIPLFLWYCHKSVTLALRAAVFFSIKVFTCSENGMNVRSRKKRVIGHGIDLKKILFSEIRHDPGTLLCAGRISPVKNVHVLVDVMDELVNRAGLRDLKLLIAGGPTELKRDRRYLRRVRCLVSEKNLDDHVLFLGEQNATGMIELYQRSLLLLHLSDTGSLDKVLLEAMACGCIPVSSNESFRMLYEQEFPRLQTTLDSGEIVSTVQSVLSMNQDEKERLRSELRGEVVGSHSLKRLVDVICGYMIRKNG